MTNKELFLSHIPKDGSGIGNGSLLALLSWNQSVYDAVKTELLGEGVIAPGRGRGGSVKLANPTEERRQPEPAPRREPVTNDVSYGASAEAVQEASAEIEEEQPKVSSEESAESADDPVLVYCDTDDEAVAVIEKMKTRYKKTRFYSTKVGAELKIQIQLINFGGKKQALSPDILENARQIARDVIKPAELPPPQPQSEEPTV